MTAFAWRHSLVRPAKGRLFAGVCGAFARATNTDPVLWRVIIAVLSLFGGVGVLIYLLGWLLLPADGDTASPVEAVLGRGRSATSAVLTVIGGIIVLLSFGVLFSEPFRPGPWGLVLVVGAIVLLLRDRRSGRPADAGSAVLSATANATPSPSAAHPGPAYPQLPPIASVGSTPAGAPTMSGVTMSSTPTNPVPPFAPYGPFVPASAPPPPPPAPPPPRPRSRLGRLTFSVALIVLGLVALADLAGMSVPAPTYLAVGLAVVGLGLVAGAWYGRARSLIAPGVVLTLALAIFGSISIASRAVHGGTITWAPTSVSQMDSSYQHELGNGTLDLTGVDFSSTTSPVVVDVEVNLGNLEVIVPSNVDVTVTAKVNAGNADVFSDQWGGMDPASRTVTDLGPDGKGGGELHINANVDLGNLEVHR